MNTDEGSDYKRREVGNIKALKYKSQVDLCI